MNANGQPVALVTGTSSGMGLHTAVELARRGLTVVATMRDTSRATALTDAATEAGVALDVRALDVTDHEAARACVDAVLADHGRLDVLVNNAGRGAVATAEQLSLDEIREQLEVNYLGPVALTKLVLPHMRTAGSGTVLTVTSVGGAVGQPFADAYCGAKFAVEGFMQSLAVVMLAHGVHVSVIEPAAVASDFVGNVARPETDPADPYAAQLDAYLARSAGAFAQAQSARDAAVAIADAATSTDHRFRWQTSEGATAFVGMSLADIDGSRVLGATRGWIEPAPN
ncbi:SDR family oxidoreductase [Terrabacter aerolatus]|uniref:Short-chain dehydrogenase/reductase n=1 Tax=Terrabacter aerolatus TaxID=422442 RepID=A0A512CZ29_9MICO|nr:SDR family oxidoreductase [Terrabacter aerolatus]GEO29481.1 short-chain dehydrogenase/reductase [Terrabacter aerolatus]